MSCGSAQQCKSNCRIFQRNDILKFAKKNIVSKFFVTKTSVVVSHASHATCQNTQFSLRDYINI